MRLNDSAAAITAAAASAASLLQFPLAVLSVLLDLQHPSARRGRQEARHEGKHVSMLVLLLLLLLQQYWECWGLVPLLLLQLLLLQQRL